MDAESPRIFNHLRGVLFTNHKHAGGLERALTAFFQERVREAISSKTTMLQLIWAWTTRRMHSLSKWPAELAAHVEDGPFIGAPEVERRRGGCGGTGDRA